MKANKYLDLVERKAEILGVAVHYGDLVICLPKPNRHGDVVRYMQKTLKLDIPEAPETDGSRGFYTADGTFLTRFHARRHVIACGFKKESELGAVLFSDQMW